MLPCRFNVSLDQRHKTIEHNKRKAVNLLQLAKKKCYLEYIITVNVIKFGKCTIQLKCEIFKKEIVHEKSVK